MTHNLIGYFEYNVVVEHDIVVIVFMENHFSSGLSSLCYDNC